MSNYSRSLQPPIESETNSLNRFHTFLTFIPWLWVLGMGGLLLGAIVQYGHWPIYGQPDPKYMGIISWLHWPTSLLVVLTMASIPVWLILTGWLWLNENVWVRRRNVFLYVIGIALFAIVAIADWGGLMSWFID